MEKSDIQDSVLSILIHAHRAGVNVSVGGGKTRIGLRHMQYIVNTTMRVGEPKFLVVAPRLSIFDSWKNEAKEACLEYLLDYITFSTYISLDKNSYDYDVIYLDECHSLLPSHDLWLSFYHNKIIGLTGTKPRYSKSDKGVMVAKYCPIVYTYKTDDGVKDGILNNYKIFVKAVPLSNTRNLKMTKKSGGFWYTSEQDSYNYWTSKIMQEEDKEQPDYILLSKLIFMM